MVRISTPGAEAKARLLKQGPAAAWREPYIEAIQSLSGDEILEVEPEDDETLRQIRMRLSWTARQLGKDIQVGETLDRTLLVWRGHAAGSRRRRTKQIQGSRAAAKAQAE
jgi:hypothetical protein